MPALSIKALAHRRREGEKAALAETNLEIADREFVVITGPPDSGKSTLLRLIAGLETPSQGEISLDGKRLHDLPPKDRALGMVFQNDALYPPMSVFDNLAFGLKTRKYSAAEIQKRVRDAAAVLGLDDLLPRKPKALSAAQRQRLAVARAIVRQPKLLLLDEPLGEVEGPPRKALQMEVGKLHQRLQTTTLLATCNSAEALQMADRLVVLNDGVVQQDDLPQNIYREPANVFVAGFFGDLPMNFVHGSLKAEGDKFRFRENEAGTIDIVFQSDEQPTTVRDYVGKNVILGIRPDDLEASAFNRAQTRSTLAFPAIADAVEPTGSGTNIYLETGAHTLVCRSREKFDRQDAGHRFQFEIDLKAIHLFDPASGSRIN